MLHFFFNDIKRKRKENGITQVELAKKVGTKHSAISRLESGTYNSSVLFLEKVFNALDMGLSINLDGHNEGNIWDQCKAERKEKGITQVELARMVGTKHSAISRFESGRYNPSVEFLEKYTKALGKKLSISIE